MATLKERFVNALFGKHAPDNGVMQVSMDYGKDLQNYMDTLPQQDYAQNLYNGNLTREQVNQGIANGLNYGLPQIKAKQEELGIRIPQTDEERELARNGQFNNYPMVTSINNSPRQGGFLRDFASGYNENLNEGFNINNLEPDKNKGFATKLGEGLGTLTRFYNKPIGRMVAATGLSMLTGEANPLGEGVKAYVGRQTNMTKDKAYRNQLRNLGMSAAEVNAIPGIMTGDIYKNISDSYKARWNKASWGDLASVNPAIAEAVKNNPELANSYLPASVANTILKGELTDAQIANLMARTKLAGIQGEVLQQNADANTLRANSYAGYMGKRGVGSETQYADLAEFQEILSGKDDGKIQFARNAYIAKYGNDPMKLIKQ